MRGRTDSSYEQFEIKCCPWKPLGGATSGPTGPLAVLGLVRLLAVVRAVSCKNMPKNNIYTSKIIIPARTLPPQPQRH